MDFTGLLLFATVYLVAVASPGPGMALVVARGLSVGTRSAPAFIAGFVVGDLVWFTVAATGMAVVARAFETLFLFIKFAGCLYLLFLAWRIWTSPIKTADAAAVAVEVKALPSFLSSLSLTLGNPKVIVFFLSLMPLVVDLQSLTPIVFAELAAVIVLVFTPVLAATLLLAERARRVFQSERALRRINKGTAAMMAGAAVAIAARS
jgi:threonine/homoserine/homoserine lactone efflux protein